LSFFIQNNSKYFNYDINSGNVSNNQILVKNDIKSDENELLAKQKSDSKPFINIDLIEEPIVSSFKILKKPQYLLKLEENKTSLECCLTNGQKLSAIEIIIYVLNTLKGFKRSIRIKDLFCLLKEDMGKQLSAINSCKQWDHNCNQNLVVSNLLNDFEDIFTVNQTNETLSLCNHLNEWLIDVENMFNNSLDSILKNFLITQFQRFGRKTLNDIEEKLSRDYNYMFQYLFGDESDYKFIDFIERYQQDFVVDYKPNDSNSFETIVIDVNPNLLSEQMRLKFQLRYEFGTKIDNLDGIVLYVKSNECLIRSKIQKFETPLYFKVRQDLTTVYGLQVIDDGLKQLLHLDDWVNFNAQFMRAIDPQTNGVKEYSWFVTKIVKVRHSAQCYLPPFCSLFTENNWDNDRNQTNTT
jgi:hypothetical protein